MPSWIHRASLLLLFLLSFDTSSLVFGAPQQPPTHLARQLKPLGAETNAKRFARDLPPLPPVRRGSGTDTARRSTTSDTQVVTKKIKVTGDNQEFGYLQLRSFLDRYIVGSAATASRFQTTLSTTGGTLQANLFDLNAGTTPYLAGLIGPGIELTSGNFATGFLGGANPPTSQGSTPQSSGTTSYVVGYEYETAIWNVSPSSVLTLSWVNHNGVSSPITLLWYPVAQIMYLSANSIFGDAIPVTLSLE